VQGTVKGSIAILRIFWGLVYFSDGLSKFYPEISRLPLGQFLINRQDARNILASDVARHPVALYHDLVFNFILPNYDVFGPLLGLAEMVAGGLLILGLMTKLGALLAALMALHLNFATLGQPQWVYEYAVEWVTLLCIAFMRAGRYFGLDGATGNRRMA
jgi:uncharacterized membrane protein YphA (DoxX/SURF4 family)